MFRQIKCNFNVTILDSISGSTCKLQEYQAKSDVILIQSTCLFQICKENNSDQGVLFPFSI